MPKIKKTFHSVGQGCFYSELFWHTKNKYVSLIYDCGSNNVDRLKKEIGQSGFGRIDYLVISHFHIDHINGLKDLKKRYKIGQVFIPKIHPWELVVYKHDKRINNGEYFDVINNPSSFFGNETKIANVIVSGDGNNRTAIPSVGADTVRNVTDLDIEDNQGIHFSNLPSELNHNDPVIIRYAKRRSYIRW